MKDKKVYSIIVGVMLVTLVVAAFPAQASSPRIVHGQVYIDNAALAPDGVTVKIIPDQSDPSTNDTYANGNYVINFGGIDYEECTFSVEYLGVWYQTTPSAIELGDDSVIEYSIDLYVTTGGDGDGDGDGDGHSSNSGGGGNQPPVADASESQIFGYVNESINFNGSKSYDPDGIIDMYEWDWDNDGIYDYNSTSKITTHIFYVAGTYSVTLRVTDNDGATDKDTIEVLISKANVPPTEPTIDGASEGTKDTYYTYTFQSTDLDNDTIQYFINWGDGEVTETDFIPNGTASVHNHSWISAGIYTISAKSFDNNTPSGTTDHTVLIDVHIVDGIGYLIDDDADGTYDSFHNDTSGQETDVEKKDDGTYLIDSDSDGKWDYVYDIKTDSLMDY